MSHRHRHGESKFKHSGCCDVKSVECEGEKRDEHSRIVAAPYIQNVN